MRKRLFAYAKTKTQISFAVTAASRNQCLFFATRILPKSETIFCDGTARFVSDQIRTPENRFSHNEAHIQYIPERRG